jgi:hypothetical protein
MSRILLYLLRWQASGLILAPCIAWLPYGAVAKAVVANLVGGVIFYWVDKQIFRNAPG